MTIPNIKHVAGWHRELLTEKRVLTFLKRRRGLTKASIKAAQLGYDIESQRVMIPVLDGDRVLNVRRYNPKAREGRPKIIGAKGSRVGWYVAAITDVDAESVVVTEGELDALLTAQDSHAPASRKGHLWDRKRGHRSTEPVEVQGRARVRGVRL